MLQDGPLFLYLFSLDSPFQDERGRLMRRNIVRYAVLAYVITLKHVSIRVKKRFPTLQHIVDAGEYSDSGQTWAVFEILIFFPILFKDNSFLEINTFLSSKRNSAKNSKSSTQCLCRACLQRYKPSSMKPCPYLIEIVVESYYSRKSFYTGRGLKSMRIPTTRRVRFYCD